MCRTKKIVELKTIISPAKQDEVHRGWIRVSSNLRGSIPNGAYVKVAAAGKQIFCQVRGTPGETGCVKISEWYREALGLLEISEEVELRLEEVGLLGRINAWSSHPDDIVRVAVGLGFISAGLGLLSLIVSFAPYATGSITSSCLIGRVFEALVVIAAISVSVTIAVLAVFLGFWMFTRKFPGK